MDQRNTISVHAYVESPTNVDVDVDMEVLLVLFC